MKSNIPYRFLLGVFSLVALACDPGLTLAQTNCATPPANLVGWWSGDGMAFDLQGGNESFLLPATAYATGKVDLAFSLQTAGAGVRILASPALDVGKGGGFTVEGWIQCNQLASGLPIAEWVKQPGYGVHLYAPGAFGGSLYANLVGTDGLSRTVESPAGLIQVGTPQHVALTYDKASGMARLFAGGILVKESFVGSFTPQTSGDFYLGHRPLGSPDGPITFSGLLDEISVYSRALSASEIQVVFAAGSGGKCFNPAPPQITVQPANQVVESGGNAAFDPWAVGTGPLHYQWLSNSIPISGATNRLLLLTNLAAQAVAGYSFVVTNNYGMATSEVATLAVMPAIFSGITNGSFENGLNGWTGVAAVAGPPERLPVGTDGTHAAWLGGFDSQNHLLQQSIRVVPATNYTLTLDTAANSEIPGRIGTLEVVIQAGNHVLVSNRVSDASVTFMEGSAGFSTKGMSFWVPEGTYDLTLKISDRTPAGGAGIDSYLDRVQMVMSTPSLPIVAQPPASQSISAGDTLNLSVQADGTNPFQYQWLFGGSSIAGATRSSLTLTNIQPGQAGNYAVRVSNVLGDTVSPEAAVTVLVSPFQGLSNGSFESALTGWTLTGSGSAVGPPGQAASGVDGTHAALLGTLDSTGASLRQRLKVIPGTNYLLSFSTAASATTAGRTTAVQVVVSCLGKAISSNIVTDFSPLAMGGTNGFLTRSAAFSTPPGAYDLEVAFSDVSPNAGRGVDCLLDAVVLTIGQPPVAPLVIKQPANITTEAGGTATLSVIAVGTEPLEYQWFRNSVPLAGATRSAVNLSGITSVDTGNYTALILNAAGWMFTTQAQVSLLPFDYVTLSNPSFESGLTGWSTTSGVSQRGPPTLPGTGTDGTHAAQIRYNASLSQAAKVSPGTSYLLSFDTSTFSSTTGSVSVLEAVIEAGGIAIASHKVKEVSTSAVGFHPQSVFFTTSASVSNVLVRFKNVTPGGSFAVDFLLDFVRLAANRPPEPPSFVSQPGNRTIPAGGVLSLETQALGSGPFGYQWFWQGNPLSGATSSQLTVSNIQPTQSGAYSVQVANPVGQITSTNALVTVLPPPFGVVLNGSFENGLTNWSSVGTLVVGSPGSQAIGTDGTHAATIGAFDTAASYVQQSIFVLPGTNYLLNFDLCIYSPSSRPGSIEVVIQAQTNTLASALFTSSSVATMSGSNGFTPWTLRFSTPTTVSNVTLAFIDKSPQNGAGVDPFVDNVRLNPVSEPNLPPVASNLLLGTRLNQTLALLKTKVLLSCYDPNGDAVAVSPASSISLKGGIVSDLPAAMVYTPPLGFVGTDEFTYIARDQQGAAGTAKVIVEVRSVQTLPATLLRPLITPSGLLIQFTGVPGFAYQLQRALSPAGPWEVIAAVDMPVNGIAGHLDGNPPSNGAVYRAVQP